MYPWIYTIIMSVSAMLLSAAGTYAVREYAAMIAPPRDPNERDNHSRPVPKGGGIAVMLSIIGFLTVTNAPNGLIMALLLLLVISCIDDFGHISPLHRLIAHLVAAFMIILSLERHIFPEFLSYPLEILVLTLALTWWINLYNFMDGIDEITSRQTIVMCSAIIVMSFLHEPLPNIIAYDSVIVISAVIAFWAFNRHPASVFLGDSGSIPLGAVTGWLLLVLAKEGYTATALILPAYYVTDASLTLLRRLMTGHKPWEAHSEHGYQRFVRSGRSHLTATRLITLVNLLLVGLAFAHSEIGLATPYAVAAAYGLSIVFYLYLVSHRPQKHVISRTASVSDSVIDSPVTQEEEAFS